MMNIEQQVQSLQNQLPDTQAMRQECCVDLVKRLLDVMDVNDVIELVKSVHAEEFAKGEIASYHSMQVWGDDDDGLPF
ncbi:hypothetical protein KRX11_10360 [Pasteurellaceae bacterium TAE3-ERU1]|nr:hypothetical protein [Pasteurellaceae bacterium TAE3-ERU1]